MLAAQKEEWEDLCGTVAVGSRAEAGLGQRRLQPGHSLTAAFAQLGKSRLKGLEPA